MPNHLIHESSPYLIQHVNNPIDWYPWGEAAFIKAMEEGKPIFLSIGYASCHWCHVMERESFQDQTIASMLNQYFVCIKVDREERPDLDHIYMAAVIAMTGSGGWPLNVFLTPDKRPFFGGTYFPPIPRFRQPSFRSVLDALIRAWKNDQEKLVHSGEKITQFLSTNLADPNFPVKKGLFDMPQILSNIESSYDWKSGGWGIAPKFPHPATLEFLLILTDRYPQALEMAVHALNSMQRGGFYDLVGGGFHRYSTDPKWNTPHFEKMLTDNAQLALAYLRAYKITGNPQFRLTCEKTLDFILREMTHPDGGFYSSLDSDSEGEEGIFYSWSHEEISLVFPDPAIKDRFLQLHHLTDSSFHQGRVLLTRAEENHSLATDIQPIEQMYAALLGQRESRVRPSADDKIVLSMNALALQAFAEASRYLARPDYLLAAQKNAQFLLNNLYANHQLMRTWRNGKSTHPALLEDYASLILGLIALYQVDFNSFWLENALQLARTMIEQFYDPSGIFFDVASTQSDLLFKPITWDDDATPSAMALAVKALFYLSCFYHLPDWLPIVKKLSNAAMEKAITNPLGYSSWLQNAYLHEHEVEQIAILFPPGDLTHIEWLQWVNTHYKPARIIASSVFPPSNNAPGILQNYQLIEHNAAFYRCVGFACQRPLTDPREIETSINQ